MRTKTEATMIVNKNDYEEWLEMVSCPDIDNCSGIDCTECPFSRNNIREYISGFKNVRVDEW